MEESADIIIGGIFPNVVAFLIFCSLIIYFAKTGRMAKMLGWKNNDKNF